MDEINVKKISFNPKLKEELSLDKKLTKELIDEGQYRELVRTIQGIRQELELTPKDKVLLSLTGFDPEIKKFIDSIAKSLIKEVKAKKLVINPITKFIKKQEIEIKGKVVILMLGR
jgi:hypothetical protein